MKSDRTRRSVDAPRVELSEGHDVLETDRQAYVLCGHEHHSRGRSRLLAELLRWRLRLEGHERHNWTIGLYRREHRANSVFDEWWKERRRRGRRFTYVNQATPTVAALKCGCGWSPRIPTAVLFDAGGGAHVTRELVVLNEYRVVVSLSPGLGKLT